LLKRYRNIQTHAAVLQKVGNGLVEVIFFDQDSLVVELLLCLPGKQRMDAGGFAVRNRVAHDGVMIHQLVVFIDSRRP